MQQGVFSALSVVIVALVSVMLVSAFRRLSLYEMAYGFSRLRAYVHVSLIWIGLLLAAVVVLELLHRERLFAAAALIAALGFAISLGVLNVDGFIVRQNVQRAFRGESLDAPYLVSLSTDADPVLVDIFNATPGSIATREAVGAVLACRSQRNAGRAPADWRAFTLSRWRSNGALMRIQDQLDGYRLLDGALSTKIVTPSGVEYDCLSSPD